MFKLYILAAVLIAVATAQPLTVGCSVSFEGNGYVTLPVSPIYELSTATYEMWIKPTSGSPMTTATLLTSGLIGANQDSAVMLQYDPTSSTVGVQIWSLDSSTNQWLSKSFTSTYTIPVDSWTQVAFVPSLAVLYVNANSVALSYTGNSYSYPAESFAVGMNFYGAIDEVRIWNTVRSSQDIYNNLYNTICDADLAYIPVASFKRQETDPRDPMTEMPQPAEVPHPQPVPMPAPQPAQTQPTPDPRDPVTQMPNPSDIPQPPQPVPTPDPTPVSPTTEEASMLALYLTFDECTGTAVYDLLNGVCGTIVVQSSLTKTSTVTHLKRAAQEDGDDDEENKENKADEEEHHKGRKHHGHTETDETDETTDEPSYFIQETPVATLYCTARADSTFVCNSFDGTYTTFPVVYDGDMPWAEGRSVQGPSVIFAIALGLSLSLCCCCCVRAARRRCRTRCCRRTGQCNMYPAQAAKAAAACSAQVNPAPSAPVTPAPATPTPARVAAPQFVPAPVRMSNNNGGYMPVPQFMPAPFGFPQQGTMAPVQLFYAAPNMYAPVPVNEQSEVKQAQQPQQAPMPASLYPAAWFQPVTQVSNPRLPFDI